MLNFFFQNTIRYTELSVSRLWEYVSSGELGRQAKSSKYTYNLISWKLFFVPNSDYKIYDVKYHAKLLYSSL